MVYAKPRFAGPQQVLTYVGRYTHRVAISNQRLLDIDDGHVRFRYKDYRADRREREKTMTLGATEFIRRFLLHVPPGGFHRIRYYGLLGSRTRRERTPFQIPSKRRDSAEPTDGHAKSRPATGCVIFFAHGSS